MIDPAAKLSVSRQAIVLGISRGSVYYKPRPLSDADLKLMHRIDRLHMPLRLPSAQGGVVGQRPIQVRHPEQAGHHPCRLLKRQLEKDPDGQTELDRRIQEHRRATGTAATRREPGHHLVQPDQQRSALAKRSRVVGPVRCAIAGG